jgi:GTP-binding protein EngB required for normal cell division
MTLELKKFDMSQISFKADENKGPVVVLIGRRDTGKSFLVRDLLYYHQELKRVMASMANMFQNYLFMTNTILLLLKIY